MHLLLASQNNHVLLWTVSTGKDGTPRVGVGGGCSTSYVVGSDKDKFVQAKLTKHLGRELPKIM